MVFLYEVLMADRTDNNWLGHPICLDDQPVWVWSCDSMQHHSLFRICVWEKEIWESPIMKGIHVHEAFSLDCVNFHCYCQTNWRQIGGKLEANWRQISDNVSAHVHLQCMCQNWVSAQALAWSRKLVSNTKLFASHHLDWKRLKIANVFTWDQQLLELGHPQLPSLWSFCLPSLQWCGTYLLLVWCHFSLFFIIFY